MGRGKGRRKEEKIKTINRFSWARWRGRFLIGYYLVGFSVYRGSVRVSSNYFDPIEILEYLLIYLFFLEFP